MRRNSARMSPSSMGAMEHAREPKAITSHGQTMVRPASQSAAKRGLDSLRATASTSSNKSLARKKRSRASKQQAAMGYAQENLSHNLHHATAPQKGKKSHIFCGNNILSPKLRQNGGDMEIGSPSACFRKGFGAGFHQEIDPAHLEDFLKDHIGPYKRYIEQPLYYGDGPVPAGKFRATLSQCRSRGFGVGSVQRAKKILKEQSHGI